MGSIAAKPLSRMEIRTVAKLFQKLMNAKCYFDIIAFLEHNMAYIDPDFVLEVVEDSKLPFAYARSYPDKHLIQVRESVYYYLRADRKLEAYKDPEWQANTFAGELLVPEEIAINYTVPEIAKICGVSYKVAGIQKQEVLRQKNSHQTALKFGGVAQ